MKKLFSFALAAFAALSMNAAQYGFLGLGILSCLLYLVSSMKKKEEK